MILLSLAAAGLALLLFLPTLSDLLSLLRIGVGRGVPPRASSSDTPAFLFMVPAHNERILIQGCVESLLAVDYPPHLREVVVVADNCSDETAGLAREAGARVLERTDTERRGKPWALAWALEQEELSRFDAVVIVDADTVVDGEFLLRMARRAPLRERAVQGVHGVRNPTDNAVTRMGTVLAAAYYRYMYPLRNRAGLSVPLAGNGMCIGTGILLERGWRAFSIAEDTELYVDLTRGGYRVEVEPEAVVQSQAVQELSQSRTQRARWRAGRLAILKRLGWKVARAGDLTIHQKVDILGELITPGPIVHLGVALLAAAAVALLQPPAWPLLLVLLGLPVLRLVVYSLLALRDQPDPWRTAGAFLFLPIYLVWRMATEVVAFRTDGDRVWVRTERHTPSAESEAARRE